MRQPLRLPAHHFVAFARHRLELRAVQHLDAAAALFRLGITKEAAELIETLSPAQLLKIAAGNMVLCRFRFDNRVLGDMLSGYVKDKIMASSHAAVLMAGQAAEPVAA